MTKIQSPPGGSSTQRVSRGGERALFRILMIPQMPRFLQPSLRFLREPDMPQGAAQVRGELPRDRR